MNSDDFLYIALLAFSMEFGKYYRKFDNAEDKKKIGALIGLFIVIAVSSLHFCHVIITILVNAFIILQTDKRYCHLYSFAFSFAYLVFFRTTVYFGIPYPPSHTNLVQMILTLKLVGLAFEINSSYTRQMLNDVSKNKLDEELQDTCYNTLNFTDIFYYALNYAGVLTGPYCKYKTYYDHLHKPFYKYDDYKTETVTRLFPLVPIFAILYLYTDYMWPLSYTQTEEFEQRSFLYRYWYIWPTFLNFRMRIYIGLTLSECVCIMAGLGVYPSFAKSQPGNGPSENLAKINEICDNEEDLRNTKYNYATIHSINPYGTEFYPTLRDGMKNWNMTVQYWLATCIYKRFPNKKFRTFATMFVSGVWHGVYSGYYISVGLIPFGLMLEDVWVNVLLKDEYFLPKKVGYVILLFLKMQFFSYAALAFSLLDVHKIMHYYNLVYHWMVPFWIIFFIFGKLLLNKKKANSSQACTSSSRESIKEQKAE